MITGSPWICPGCTCVCYVTVLGLREVGNCIRQLCISPPHTFSLSASLLSSVYKLKLQPCVRFPAGCVHWQMDSKCGTMFESPQQSAGVVGSVPVFYSRGWVLLSDSPGNLYTSWRICCHEGDRTAAFFNQGAGSSSNSKFKRFSGITTLIKCPFSHILGQGSIVFAMCETGKRESLCNYRASK